MRLSTTFVRPIDWHGPLIRKIQPCGAGPSANVGLPLALEGSLDVFQHLIGFDDIDLADNAHEWPR